MFIHASLMLDRKRFDKRRSYWKESVASWFQKRNLHRERSPPRGLGRGGAHTVMATAAAAVGPWAVSRGSQGGDKLGWVHIEILEEAPTYYTKVPTKAY